MPRGPVVRRPGGEGRPPPGRDEDDARPRRRPRRGQPPDLGHPQVARLVRGDEGRPAHRRDRRRDERHGRRRARDAAAELPGDPRPVRDPRLGARPRAGPPRQRGPDRRGGPGPAHGRPVPVARRDGPDPRQRADGAPDPRVRRPRHGARPDPRLGGGLRRDLLARPEAARLAPLRLGADEHHRRRDAPRRPRQLRLRRRGHARPPGRHREGGHLGRDAERPRQRGARRHRPVRRRGPRRRLRPDPDGPDDERRPAARRPHARGRSSPRPTTGS